MSKDATLRATFTAVDKVSGPMAKMNKSLNGLKKSMGGIGSAGASLARGVAVPLAALGGGAMAGAIGSVKKFLDYSGKLQDASERLGVSSEKLQEWGYVAQKSGVDSETLYGSMEKLNKSMFAAAGGKGAAADLFKKLGINVKDSNGHLKTSADIMPQLADAFAKNENATLRTAMATTLMGKSGGAMVGVLSQGSAAIAKQAQEARALGGVLSDKQIAAGDAFSDEKWLKLTTQMNGLALTLGSALLPVLEPIVTKFSKWLEGNHTEILKNMNSAITAVGGALESIDWVAVGTGITDLWHGAEKFISVMGGWQNAAIGIIALTNASTIAGIVTLGKEFATLGFHALGALDNIAKMATTDWGPFSEGMKNANSAGGKLAGTLGRLGMLAAAGAAGYEIGDKLINPMLNKGIEKMTGSKDATLGTWLYDKINPNEGAMIRGTPAPLQRSGAPALLAANGGQKLQGSADINIKLDGLPQGSRVDMGNKQIPGIGLNLDAGYRSMALGT